MMEHHAAEMLEEMDPKLRQAMQQRTLTVRLS
jgi:hypothetical protein